MPLDPLLLLGVSLNFHSAGSAAGKLRVVCGSCKNALSIKPHLGSTRFLIESPHDQPAGTRFLMSFYISHVVTRFKQLSRSTTKIFVISPDQGAAETIDLAQKLYPECTVTQIATEDLTSFAAIPTWGSSVVVVPARGTAILTL